MAGIEQIGIDGAALNGLALTLAQNGQQAS
jgi:hypothetical protein